MKEKSAPDESANVKSPQANKKKAKHSSGAQETTDEAPSVSPVAPAPLASKGRGNKQKVNESKTNSPEDSNAKAISSAAKESPSLKSKVESLKKLFTFSKEKKQIQKEETSPNKEKNSTHTEVNIDYMDDTIIDESLEETEKSMSNEEVPAATSTQNVPDKMPVCSESPKPVTPVKPQAPKVAISTMAFLKLQKFRSKVDSNSSDDSVDGNSLLSPKKNLADSSHPPVNVQQDANSVPPSHSKTNTHDAFKAIKNLGKKLHSSQKMKVSSNCDNHDVSQRSQPSQGPGYSSQIFTITGDDFDDVDLEL